MHKYLYLLGVLLLGLQPARAQDFELNTVLMQCTFKIQGPSAAENGMMSVGTIFILGKPTQDPTRGAYVLITAAHVLDGIKGDNAQIMYRREKADGSYEPLWASVRIRSEGLPLYKKHATADVAAMYVLIPKLVKIPLLPTSLISSDDYLKQIELHPGDLLFCLGFPFGLASNDAGFPILRSGTIATYPLLPQEQVKTFGFNFSIFGGNSGGPVYFDESLRPSNGGMSLGRFTGIIGLVSQQSQDPTTRTPLSLAVVQYGKFILETIDSLGTPPVVQ